MNASHILLNVCTLGIPLSFLLLAGCANTPERYNDIVRQIDQSMMVDRVLPISDCEWYVNGITPDGEPVVSKDILGIEANSGRIVLRANEYGQIPFPIRAEWRRENPRVRFLSESRIELRTLAAVFTHSNVGDGPIYNVHNPLDNETYEASGFVVYYPAGKLEAAEISAKELRKQQAFISEQLGVDQPAISVNLVGGRDLAMLQKRQQFIPPSQMTLQPNPSQLAFSFLLGWNKNPSAIHFNVHEWTELNLIRNSKIRLHQSDREGRNRIIVDGLAEYIAFRYLGGVPVERFRQDALEDLLRVGVGRADMTRCFRSIQSGTADSELDGRMHGDLELAGYGELLNHVPFRRHVLDLLELAGYAVGLHFWERLAREYGEDLPRRFIQSVIEAEPEDCDFEGCLAILETLTGKRQLEALITNADMAETLAFFNALPVAE